ncbi:MAG: ExbD/TolR family protein [Paracoccaceae bacterium]
MELKRPPPRRSIISLVPLVDVMLILLVFFMVTSTYLDLDMVPVVEKADAPSSPSPPSQGEARGASAILIRLAPDGHAYVHGQPLDAAALDVLIRDRLAVRADVPVIVLPSGHARVQSLVGIMETVSGAGATAMRVVRLEARP